MPETVTTDQEPRERGALAYACIVWAVMLATASAQVSMVLPGAIHEKLPLLDRVQDGGDVIIIAFCWISFLASEHSLRHDPDRARLRRRTAWMFQCMLAGLIGYVGYAHKHPLLGVVDAGFAIVVGMVWNEWMKSLALHPDDQKVIDELREREAELIAEEQRQAEQRLREAKLRRAMSQLRVKPPHVAESEPMGEPPLRWQIPKGKHNPLVYFIENGNRVKIGTTSSLAQRISALSLRPGNVVLLLPGSSRLERELHKQFAAYRVGTSEWFQNTGALTEYIAAKTAEVTSAGREG